MAGSLLSDGTTSYSYDGNGNLLAAGTDSFSWDWANRLVATEVGGVAVSYQVDGDGVRAWTLSTRFPQSV